MTRFGGHYSGGKPQSCVGVVWILCTPFSGFGLLVPSLFPSTKWAVILSCLLRDEHLQWGNEINLLVT